MESQSNNQPCPVETVKRQIGQMLPGVYNLHPLLQCLKQMLREGHLSINQLAYANKAIRELVNTGEYVLNQ